MPFQVGDKVWYLDGSRGERPAIITGSGTKNGEVVYDLTVEDAADKFDRDRWGYEDQILPR